MSVHGATLTESISTHTLFAPVSDVPLPIQAQTKFAEFQLESVAREDSTAPSLLNIPGKFGLAAGSALSFRVLGHDDESSDTPSIRSLSLPSMNGTSRIPTVANNAVAIPAPRILICGNRSGNTAAYSVSLINKSLSGTTMQDGTLRDGVAFLDLDYSSPSFGCPGTISIAHMRRFVLGPSYTHPLALNSTSANSLVASHFIGSDEHSNNKAPDKAAIDHLVKVDKSLGGLPWVIRTGAWLANASAQELVQLYQVLAPLSVVCIDNSKSSPFFDAAMAMTKAEPIKFAHVPYQRSTTSSSLSEHRNMLQSHFRLYGYVEDVPLWYQGSMPDGTKQLSLSTNDGEQGLSFISISGGVLRHEDVLEALEGALVTLIGAKFGTKVTSDAERIHLRNIDDSEESHHLGLAYIDACDELAGTIRLKTPVTVNQIQECLDAGFEIGVVLSKPGPTGRFGRQLLFE